MAAAAVITGDGASGHHLRRRQHWGGRGRGRRCWRWIVVVVVDDGEGGGWCRSLSSPLAVL